MSQTSVLSGGQPFGVGGQVADSGDFDIVSGFSRDPEQVPFGVGLMQKPGEADAFLLPTGNSGTMEVIGVNVFSHDHVRAGSVDGAGNQTGDLGASGLLPNASLQVMRQGRVVVPVAFDVKPNDRAFCYFIATGSLSRGLWVGSNMGGSFVRDCSTQGVFRSVSYTATDGTTKVAVLECDFTNKAV